MVNNGYGCKFINCHVKADIYGRAQVSGMVGYGGNSIYTDCTFEGTIYSTNDTEYPPNVRGLSGYGYQFTNCHVRADIIANGNIGGITSGFGGSEYALCFISGCSFKGLLNGKSSDDSINKSKFIGGLIATFNYGTIENHLLKGQ